MRQQIVAVLALLVLDIGWVSLVMRRKYEAMVPKIQGGTPMRANLWFGALAYALMAAGLLAFCVRADDSPLAAAGRGAAFGLVVYGVYDLTCASVLKDFEMWPLGAMDVAWGMFVYAAAATAAVWLK